MQNRFTCRAKDIDTNKWVYGFYAELPCGLSSSGSMDEFSDVAHYILTCKTKQSSLFSNAEPHEVIVCETYKIDENTLGQCTGKKDKNTKLIYEGDIIKTSPSGYFDKDSDIFYVKYTTGGFYLARPYKNMDGDWECDDTISCYDEKLYEVIGNIYDDFKLLVSEE